MLQDITNILTINAGSSSIKFALYKKQDDLVQQLSGVIERIGLTDAVFTIKEQNNNSKQKINAPDLHTAIVFLIEWMEKQEWFHHTNAIGHRIVHGMHHTHAEIVTDVLLNELNNISNYDPDHLPAEIQIIQLIKQRYPDILQVACFDTSFHTTIPIVAKKIAIPKKYYEEGLQRYGFHGISYSYLLQQLKKDDEVRSYGRVILAHLGNGASMAGVKNGKCMDTTMGFTPAGGLVMSTRSGDIDPGTAWYLMQKGIDAKKFNDIINHQSGLLGISGISADMYDLLQLKKENENAALAVDIFCYQAKKYIGAYTAALGGLDILVFSGGIGEHSPEVRSEICNDLEFMGIELDEIKNMNNELIISTEASKVTVRVIKTNEEVMIASMVDDILDESTK